MDDKASSSKIQFPPLEQCIVLDARVTSRKNIVRDLNETKLFLKAIEAESFTGGLEFLEQHAVAACFIGPALTPASAANFIRQGIEKTFLKTCAFVSFVVKHASHHQELEEAGSHHVVSAPYSNTELADSIVKAVVRADPNGRWAAIVRDALSKSSALLHGQDTVPTEVPPLIENGSDASPTATDAPTALQDMPTDGASLAKAPAESATIPPEKVSAVSATAQRLGSALLSAAPHMKAISARVRSGELGLDDSGKPNRPAAEALAKLVESILAGAELEERLDTFRTFFESALAEWFLDVCQTGSKEAAENLRRRLAEFAG